MMGMLVFDSNSHLSLPSSELQCGGLCTSGGECQLDPGSLDTRKKDQSKTVPVVVVALEFL